MVNFCFHSLQTGKCIARDLITFLYSRLKALVSIPFKRESAFQVADVESILNGHHKLFPFPSNGKVHSKDKNPPQLSRPNQVSIPFKRESAFQDLAGIRQETATLTFPFPSNGKVHSKDKIVNNAIFKDETAFPFPSNGKVHSKETL